MLPHTTTGRDNVPGATRTTLFPTLIGAYNITELVTEFGTDDRGSFVQKFEQLDETVPLEYRSGNGSFSGYWITLIGQYVFKYETALEWSVYACETGYPRGMLAVIIQRRC